ncbi:hypothetical protein CO134_01160 [Candidatus Kuenenbacteria bacterium CG_4_9_14_3_um_filter_39_14]|uniref:Uncharacterized protein n=2 Tax=Candidatus Kueneniibacteriota TaxID=1752740 RepID=A0A2G9Z7W8_9BACT|nr:MAG: hypothetical protein COX28_00265 [Candidatus Kuenenbacteria bacterium CG23_combo_of_CG06-09_8_20_14_all_39_39]PJA92217.1 MAG: hypothetical protein CO134_01160 [Candidatus Kuenenbacteria bacterium CG_4_9_14_3_um_filter_39_14]
MTRATQEAIKHLIVVFFYSGVSSILPIVIAWIEKDPRWALLIPVTNSIWYAVSRYLKEKRLIENGQL